MPLAKLPSCVQEQKAAEERVGGRFSCLCRPPNLASQSERQQKSASEGVLAAFDEKPILLPRARGSKRARRRAFLLLLSNPPSCLPERKAAEEPVGRHFSCLWRKAHLAFQSERQQKSASEGVLAAFVENPILLARAKGSKRARRKVLLLPLSKTPSCLPERKAAKERVGRHFSCLCRKPHLACQSERQQKSASEGVLAAFDEAPILLPGAKGSKRARRRAF